MTPTDVYIGIVIGYMFGLFTIPSIVDSLRANKKFQRFLDKIL